MGDIGEGGLGDEDLYKFRNATYPSGVNGLYSDVF
jgi:hypothetical protein